MLPSIIHAIRDAISGLDVAAASSLINQACGSDPTLEMSLMANSRLPRGVMVWQVDSSSNGRLWINRHFEGDSYLATRLICTLPLFRAYHRQGNVQPGCVAVNLDDTAELPGIAFCANRAEFTLVPDPVFINFEGYQATRRAYAEAHSSCRGTRGLRHPTPGNPAHGQRPPARDGSCGRRIYLQSSTKRRNLSTHRARVGPMLPTGIISCRATST